MIGEEMANMLHPFEYPSYGGQMNDAAGHYEFVKASAAQLVEEFSQSSPEVTTAITAATGAQSKHEIEQHRSQLLADFTKVRDQAKEEVSQPYIHYASRFDIVGLYQSVLSIVFSEISAFQGYGVANPSWVTTLLEQGAFKLKSFFHEIHELRGKKKSLLQAIIESWKDLKFAKASYPYGVPSALPLPDTCTVALLADWGGDNPAAKRVAGIVRRAQPNIAIHLGDIYYGGVKDECLAFLRNWPIPPKPGHPASGVPPGSSFAMNGNHEMYSGGESFFNVVLPAFGQAQPFFCLEGEYWRIIGLDTAYLGGRLTPSGPDDPMAAQWNWLIGLLKNGPKRANIFLTHHQPISAHTQEFHDSATLRADVDKLLGTEGVGSDAIFGWFFGHEHRCTIYQNDAAPYNARLIGSGCIPHDIQREVACDPGCTPFEWVSGRGEDGTQNAISLYAELRFIRHQLFIVYTDERGTSLGSEMWDAQKGRLNGTPFQPDKTEYLGGQ
jgi:Calcineurin-like phosphoesterase